MRAENPEVAGATYRRRVGIGWNDVLRLSLARRLPGVVKTQIDLGGLEARQLDFEVKIDQGLQLDRQDVTVPAGFLGQAVAGKDVRAFLGLRQVGQPHGRHGLQAQQLGGSYPPVSGDDLAVAVDEHRIDEAETLNALADLADLLLGVGPGVAGIGLERFGRKHLHLQAKVEVRDMVRRIAVAVMRSKRVVVRETRGFFEIAHGALHEMESEGTNKKKKRSPTMFRRLGSPEDYGRHQASRLKLCVEEFTSRDKPIAITATRYFHQNQILS